MIKNSLEEYLILLNYIKSNNHTVHLIEKNKIQNKKIKEYAKKCNDLIEKRTVNFNNILNDKNEKINKLEKEIINLKENGKKE